MRFFGSDGPGGLRQADARGFLRQTLGETAGDVLRQCRNVTALDDVMNWAWKQVIKPQAEKDVGIRDGNLGMVDEEICLWEKIKENSDVRHACLHSVLEDAAKWTAFEERRTEVATALRPLCANEMKDLFLRPLLVHMGNLDDYDRVDGDGHRKIDVVGADTALGQHYRRGIVEYFGMSNVSAFLTHVQNTVSDLQDENFEAGEHRHVVRYLRKLVGAEVELDDVQPRADVYRERRQLIFLKISYMILQQYTRFVLQPGPTYGKTARRTERERHDMT